MYECGGEGDTKKQKIGNKEEEIRASIHPTGPERKIREDGQEETIKEIPQVEDKHVFTAAIL